MLNSYQKKALSDLRHAGFEAYPSGNWVKVSGGYRDEPIYTEDGIRQYIAQNEPPMYE